MKRQVILAILDGWGIGPKDSSNPIHVATTPNLDFLKQNFPSGALQASGVAVGLPWGEEGNSEVGHLTIGAGKVLYQHYPRITLAIKDGSFFKNPVLLNAFEHVRAHQSAINFIGLLTASNIHASLEHLLALIRAAQDQGISKIHLHLFADGKDSPPRSAIDLLKKIPLPIASLSGRYYALDRDGHWDRTRQAYDTLVGNTPPITSVNDLIQNNYQKGLNDQFIEPHLIGPDNQSIQDGDALIFFDFREDSVRQIVEPFVNPAFSEFPKKDFPNLLVASMTPYSQKFTIPVLYPPEIVTKPLGQVLSENGKSQARIAETEKYAHVTYFFNGLKETPAANEYRIMIPSANVPHPEEKPKMMIDEVTTRVTQAIADRAFDFILVNFANGDLIAHTGNYDAGIRAARAVDIAIGKITQTALAHDTDLLITSDHGNLEQMLDPMTSAPTTGHDASPVPIYLVRKSLERQRNQEEINAAETETIGILSDVAPTVLDLFGIPKPPEMTGESLLPYLK